MLREGRIVNEKKLQKSFAHKEPEIAGLSFCFDKKGLDEGICIVCCLQGIDNIYRVASRCLDHTDFTLCIWDA